MSINARYLHTNLIAYDWKSLVDFYIRVFGCSIVPPERDISGEALERGTSLPGAHLRGAHIRLPGYADSSPTLEIFRYDTLAEEGKKSVNRPGFAHIAFWVEDVPQARQMVLQNGGSAVGEIVTTLVGNTRRITWCYMADPEGNIIELQTAEDIPS